MKRILSAIILTLMPSILFAQGYEQEVSVRCDQDDITLYGSLLLPTLESGVEYPVALIISGSGPTDRNGNNRFMMNNSLKMVAEGLAAHGIASLRYDKRGIAASSSDKIKEEDVVLSTFAGDVAQWVKYLNRQSFLGRITLVGHSEGAELAMMAMVNEGVDTLVENVVLLCGPGRPLDEILKEQLATQPEHIKDISYEIIDTLKDGNHPEEVPLVLNKLFRPSVQNFLIESMQIDPAELASKISVPMLIVQGNTDIQVTQRDAELLSKANPEAEMVMIEDMNHVLKECSTMSHQYQMILYGSPTSELNGELIPTLCDFILGENEP